MTHERPQNFPLAAFVALSLILHLLTLFLLPKPAAPPPPVKEEPVYVEVRPPRTFDRELDLPVPQKETQRETPAKRLGPTDQIVKKETAPKGDFIEDRTPSVPVPMAHLTPSTPPPPAKAVPSPPTRLSEAPAPPSKPERPISKRKQPLDLFAAGQMAAQAVAERYIDDWRNKYRKDVEEGDAVWLDTEKDILHSFFRRFRDQIYGVWNYPSVAAERREEGTCLLKITVNREGEVVDVRLMESSGYPSLDREAISAVWRGGPYGKLSRHYTEETLNVFAFFQYRLSLHKVRGGDLF